MRRLSSETHLVVPREPLGIISYKPICLRSSKRIRKKGRRFVLVLLLGNDHCRVGVVPICFRPAIAFSRTRRNPETSRFWFLFDHHFFPLFFSTRVFSRNLTRVAPFQIRKEILSWSEILLACNVPRDAYLQIQKCVHTRSWVREAR